MPSQICPACFRLIDVAAKRCPTCGADIEALSNRDYADKLIAALDHPLSDVRMRAIVALGLRREARAATALVECALRHPTDVVQALAVTSTLRRLLPDEGGIAALSVIIARHPAPVVQEAAKQALRSQHFEAGVG